ncbi:hypothetical protein TD95_005135 [Thielaviopsis punctulata]|uniref:14-3-3 domain-containing protein n=1 Tax=Thielaviopsis punctulata TaxID=72032 RepID=A0A0F4ZJ01_9PEZI|nr:hypothetical protein TD95_005135 [Thielaviopsis punctulata]
METLAHPQAGMESDAIRQAVELTLQRQKNSNKAPTRFTSTKTTRAHSMASSEVDQKFLGRLAKAVEADNHLLSEMLFKILGLSLNLAEQLVLAKKERKQTHINSPSYLKRAWHILWLSREGLKMLEQYVLPMVTHYGELKVLAFKLRASFYHIFVLFYNNPVVSDMSISQVIIHHPSNRPKKDLKGKGKAVLREDDVVSVNSSIQPTHPLEGGPPPRFELMSPENIEFSPDFLVSSMNYLPLANQYFLDAVKLSDEILWGSHSLRLSVKTEYAAFLYECMHDQEGSRNLAKTTIAEVYEAQEGMDDDMFADACELVTVLGRMMKRGLGSSATARSKSARKTLTPQPAVPPPGMENPI